MKFDRNKLQGAFDEVFGNKKGPLDLKKLTITTPTITSENIEDTVDEIFLYYDKNYSKELAKMAWTNYGRRVGKTTSIMRNLCVMLLSYFLDKTNTQNKLWIKLSFCQNSHYNTNTLFDLINIIRHSINTLTGQDLLITRNRNVKRSTIQYDNKIVTFDLAIQEIYYGIRHDLTINEEDKYVEIFFGNHTTLNNYSSCFLENKLQPIK